MRTPLISPEELAQLSNVVLIDARPNADDYRRGHLRSAVWANLETELSAASAPAHDPGHGGRHPLPSLDDWAGTVGAWGIGPDTDVVIYDDQSGANAAARAWWMLRALGHEKVAVLDGGYSAALATGLEATLDVPNVAPNPPYPAIEWKRPRATVDDVKVLREDADWMIVDVRSAERFRGETEPIDPIAGHIPGAVNLPFADNLRDGVFKPANELREQYTTLLGNRAPDRLIVHCGSGVTACHTLLALEAAGLDGSALYVGSWGEWCRNDLPRIS